ncbi:unnamed protein product [Spodoptera littoralis]|uniref:Formin-binding protein 1-like n=1 Tax=Spodoptera littoralis TaxID=7109 RepID=A0A9P0N5W5_SPOLI|nr:unnamed protein product [Spodoptera littoralis]CAH1643578.1 unnamed protein product [Spodoptera littoralis]
MSANQQRTGTGRSSTDQYDNLAAHTHKGIDFLDKYGNFVKERCAIELEYAGKLRRLVKNYQPKRKEEDEYQYTACKAFKQLLQELNDFAGQREVVAENLQSNVVRELHLLAKELREERKQHLNEGAKQMGVLNSSIGSLERARRSYERAARESERALETFQKADADLNLSRAEVEKQKANMKLRSQACEDAKQEYMDQLRKTNDAQRQHYEQRLPHDLDEKRIKNIKNFMLSSVDVERKVFPIIMQCLDGMETAANSINEKENNMSMDGKEDYSDLPPNQKKKKLQAKVMELSKQVAQEQAAMEGLMKMKGVYETSPALGDPMTVEGQLNECCDKLKKLRAQLNKFEELLAEANSQVGAPPLHPTARTNGQAPTQATSIGSNSESLSRSASESSVSTGTGTGGPGARAAGGSPESGLGGELAAVHHDHHANGDHDHDPDNDHDNDHESDFDYYYCEPDLQPVGYCKALYAFEGIGSGSTMKMECGERLLVLETDAGDGWTRVRRHHTREEGFVPTTYIATTLYADANAH